MHAFVSSSPSSSRDLTCRLQLSQHVHFPICMLHALHVLHKPSPLQGLQYSGHLHKFLSSLQLYKVAQGTQENSLQLDHETFLDYVVAVIYP